MHAVCTWHALHSIPAHTSAHVDNGSMDPRPFLCFAIFCHLPLLCSLTLHLVPPPHSSSHTSTGGLSLVGIHQGPSLTPAMLQCRRTITGSGRPSLLRNTEHVCVWVSARPFVPILIMHITSASTSMRKCRLAFAYWCFIAARPYH